MEHHISKYIIEFILKTYIQYNIIYTFELLHYNLNKRRVFFYKSIGIILLYLDRSYTATLYNICAM